MSAKKRYLLSLLSLAVVVSIITILVQQKRDDRAVVQSIKANVARNAGSVNNVGQLTQVETIRAQIHKKQLLSDAQVDQLLAVVEGPEDGVLQANAEVVIITGQQSGCFSSSQKSMIATRNLTALKNSTLAVRQMAIVSLGEIGEKSVVPALLPFLNAPEPKVRRLTKEALDKIQG